MKIIDARQGTEEWLKIRSWYHTASEAPAMMAASKHLSRSRLMRIKATGDEVEYPDWTKALLEKGHEIERSARVIAQKIIGEELFPITAARGNLLASFDGLTLLGSQGWECKSWNEKKAQSVMAGKVPEEDYWQIVQQLYVSGAEKWLYMVTDGTLEKTVSVWVTPNQADFDRLLAGWNQFDEDVKSYDVNEGASELVPESVESLPAITVTVAGEVKSSNLEACTSTALAYIDSVKIDLETDQDFADAENVVKFCGKTEKKLAYTKEQVISQMPDIDRVFRCIGDIADKFRKKRLELNRLIDQKKKAIRYNLIRERERSLNDHISLVNRRFNQVKIDRADIDTNFVGAIKGKRTVVTMSNALDDELARAKSEVARIRDRIAHNMSWFEKLADGKYHLFHDLNLIAKKDHEDFKAIVTARLSEPDETPKLAVWSDGDSIIIESKNQKVEIDRADVGMLIEKLNEVIQ